MVYSATAQQHNLCPFVLIRGQTVFILPQAKSNSYSLVLFRVHLCVFVANYF